MAEKFYSVNDIAELFGVTRKAVYDWMGEEGEGRLEYIVVGARRRVTQTALDSFIANRTRLAKTEGSQKNETPGLVPALAV